MLIPSMLLLSLTPDPLRSVQGADPRIHESPYVTWENGPSTDPAFFPIGVWLQDTRLAGRYRELGVNVFVGLWQGPTAAQLALLRREGLVTICAFNEVGRAHLDDPTIIGWMQVDEPDNKADDRKGPRATPEAIVRRYERLRAADPTRPVWLNLGQGVANDAFKGRVSPRSSYPDYAEGCDILSFDVYPVANLGRDDGADLIWYVAKGLRRLRRVGGPEKILWNFVECTAIVDPNRKATPDQVRSQVWMSLIHGSRGIVYFCHQFEPEQDNEALLTDEVMSAAVAEINGQVLSLAPLLNAPEAPGRVSVETASPSFPVSLTVREAGGGTHVFAVGMRNGPTRATFTVADPAADGTIEVLFEGRTLELQEGTFEDAFGPYEVHLYRLPAP